MKKKPGRNRSARPGYVLAAEPGTETTDLACRTVPVETYDQPGSNVDRFN